MIVRQTESTAKQKILSALRIAGILLLVGLGIALASYFLVNGAAIASKTKLVASGLLAVLPLLVWLAITRPFIFPFSLFVLAIPVDNLLGINSVLGSGGVASSTQHVATLTKYLGLASAVAFGLWLLRTRRYVKPSTATYAWLALVIWMALSVFWALNTNVALAHLATFGELIALFLVVSIMPITRVELRVVIAAVIAGSLVTALYSIDQFRVGGALHAAINQSLTGSSQLRPTQAEIDPNALTAALLLPIAIVMMAFLQRRWSFAKVALGGVLAILFGAVYVVASRGGIVGLAALIGYLFLRTPRYRAQIAALSAVAVAGVLAKGFSSGSLLARFAAATHNGGSGRIYIWHVGWDAFKHHWLLGAGVGNFPVAYQQSFLHIFQLIDQGWNRVSHNTPLGIAVELGVLGLVLGGLATYWQFRSLEVIAPSDPLYDLRVCLESAFVGLIFAAIFLWVMPGKYTWLTMQIMAVARAYALCRPVARALPRWPVVLRAKDAGAVEERKAPLHA